MIKKLLFYVVLFLLPFMVLSQSLGDYKSNVTTGNWTTLSSWQYYNGTAWVTPSGTSPQGYPGQFAGTGAVLIQAGSSITMGTADLTTQAMGTLTISGTLNLDGGSSGVFTINTQNIIITSGLSPYANISFANKVTLALPTNASIQVGVGGLPTPGNGTCNNNIEISIGGNVLAYCTGSGNPKADYTFTDIINNGGYNYVNATASPSSICGSGSSTITALATPASGAIYKWYNAATGGTLLQNGGNTFNTGAISSTKIYYVDASYVSPAYTTARKAVTVSVNASPNNVTNGFVATAICTGGSPQLTYDADDTTFSTPYSITYKNDTTLQQYTVSIPTASPFSFTPGDNPTSNTGYTIVSISNATCTRTSGITNAGANLIVRPMPIATISSGATNICVGAASPNIIFTNPRTVAITVVYNINGGSNQTVDVSSNSSTNVAVATSVAGPFVYNLVSATYQSTPGCSNTITGSATVTVNPNLPASVSILASANPICSGTSVTFTATPTNGGTAPSYQWYNGVTTISGATASTYTSTTLSNGDAIKVVMTSNATCATGSPATSNVVTMTVNPNLPTSVSIAASSTGAICLGTSVTFTATPTNGGTTPTYQWYNGITPISGATTSTFTTTSLSNGDAIKVVMTSNATCATGSPTTSNVVTMTVPAAAIWNGSGWTNGPPTSAQALIFNGAYTVAGDMEACSCQVNSGNVTVNSGVTLKITNGVTVAGGSLTFEDTASLVQMNNNPSTANSGNIKYIRYTSSVLNSDYTYWSSPVTGQNLNISPSYSSGLVYSYNDFATPENWGGEQFSTIMQPGKGYIIRGNQASSSLPPSVYKATFVGVPNNGEISLPIGPQGTSNLVGNPYPSAINGSLFLSSNSLNIEGTIYIWTHNTAIQLATNITNGTAGSGTYAYTSDDYASYNGTGAVATSGGTIPTGNIAAGQSFFTTSLGTNPVIFTNEMRLSGTTVADGSGINQQFFKIKKSKEKIQSIEKNRVWLNLTNSQGAFKQTLVGYITGATNEYDSAFDGESFDSNEFLDFYSINKDKNLVIQGRALPFDEADEIPLGYTSTIIGDFEIAIGQVDGLLVDKDVFLEDKLLNKTHNLKEAPYLFTTEDGVFNDRFVLSYTNKTLSTDRFVPVEKGVLISNKNKEIKISSSIENIDAVLIYDLLGRLIYKKTNVNSKELIILNTLSAKQTVLIKVNLQGGEVINKKIIY